MEWTLAPEEEAVKNSYRMIAKPGTFIGQLQWSKHHWVILFTFLTLVGVDTLVGAEQAQYQHYAAVLSQTLGLGFDLSLFVIMGTKMALVLAGAFVLASGIWLLGNRLGRRTSKRVLFRRLAVVFTVLIGANLLPQLGWGEWTILTSWALAGWGIVLAYHAVKEQFALRPLEAGLVGAMALLLALSAWHYADQGVDFLVKKQVHQIAKPGPKGRASRPTW